MKSLTRSLANKTPVPFVPKRGLAIYPAGAGSDATTQMNAYGSNGTLFAIVNRCAVATSQVEWKLYRKRGPRTSMDSPRVEVSRHAALDLWNKPNDFMTRQEFVETFQQHIDLTGEGWWIAGRIEGISLPMELWPVRPDRMSPVPHPQDFISGYVYTAPDGQKVPLGTDEVVQLRMPNPTDPYRGLGPVQSILADIDATQYSAEWNKKFFENSAEPGGVIEMDKRLSDPEFDELSARWNENHRGVNKAHRVAILEHGKYIERKYTQRDMQFVELRNVSREVIREAFGFPKPMLGTVEDVNRANADAAEVVFSRWLVVPRLERIKQALNNDLLPMFGSTGDGVEFDYCSPVPEDYEAENAERTSKSQAVSVLVSAGYDPEDVLVAMGLPPMRFIGRSNPNAASA